VSAVTPPLEVVVVSVSVVVVLLSPHDHKATAKKQVVKANAFLFI
jgi:hypothetical protein